MGCCTAISRSDAITANSRRTRTALVARWLTLVLISGVSAFPEQETREPPPAAIAANNNRSPAGKLQDGVLTLHLELREGRWYPDEDGGPSLIVQVFAEEGRRPEIPGPLIRVPGETQIHITIRNLLGAAAVVHGLYARPGDDRQTVEVPAGATREVRFKAGMPGTYYYWATTTGKPMDERNGIDGQLSGAFIVDPPGVPPADRVFVLGVWIGTGIPGDPPREERKIVVINGKSWPYTERLTYTAGEPVRWRWINPTDRDHPMHLHGSYYRVDSTGNGERDEIYAEENRRQVVTERMKIGGTMTLTWVPERAGRWIFHCHILAHMASDLRLPHPTRASAGAAHEEDHAYGMAGLVLGITVVPGKGVVHTAPMQRPRQLRLLVRQRPGSARSLPGLGYQLQDGPAEPSVEEISVPGPPLVLTRGEPVEITVVNQLREPTAVHWHGIELESYYDGVPGWGGDSRQTTPKIAPGKSFVARMTPPRAGTFIYHTHWHDVQQLSTGLYGPLIVVEPEQKFDPETDKVFVISRGGPDEDDPLLLNGRAQPRPLRLRRGAKYRFRFINITPNNAGARTSLLAGSSPARWRAVAKDGRDLPPAQAVVKEARLVVSVGETYDFEFQPDQPGDLALEVLVPRFKIWTVLGLEVR